MSKFLPDPQIQSLRAMRAGDIAIALPTPQTMTIGTQAVASPQPVINKSITVAPAVPALQALSGTPSESPVIGVVPSTLTSQNANQSISVVAAESLETLSGTPSESPVVGVATGTLVV
jgi:hypothetical protein